MDKFLERMSELAERLGPNVVDAARGATRVEAYSSMMASGIALVSCLSLVLVGRLLWLNRERGADLDGYMVFACIAWVVAAVLFFHGVWGFLDPWVWTAINHPDLWIAHRLLKL